MAKRTKKTLQDKRDAVAKAELALEEFDAKYAAKLAKVLIKSGATDFEKSDAKITETVVKALKKFQEVAPPPRKRIIKRQRAWRAQQKLNKGEFDKRRNRKYVKLELGALVLEAGLEHADRAALLGALRSVKTALESKQKFERFYARGMAARTEADVIDETGE